jgi:hypothetical protein
MKFLLNLIYLLIYRYILIYFIINDEYFIVIYEVISFNFLYE